MIIYELLSDTNLSSLPQFIAEFDLRAVQYEVKSPRSHEMRLATPPHDCIRFNFRCDREAEEWATVVMSSLREAHRGQFDLRSFSRCFFFSLFSTIMQQPQIKTNEICVIIWW